MVRYIKAKEDRKWKERVQQKMRKARSKVFPPLPRKSVTSLNISQGSFILHKLLQCRQPVLIPSNRAMVLWNTYKLTLVDSLPVRDIELDTAREVAFFAWEADLVDVADLKSGIGANQSIIDVKYLEGVVWLSIMRVVAWDSGADASSIDRRWDSGFAGIIGEEDDVDTVAVWSTGLCNGSA